MNELGLLWIRYYNQLMNILLVIWLNKIIGQYKLQVWSKLNGSYFCVITSYERNSWIRTDVFKLWNYLAILLRESMPIENLKDWKHFTIVYVSYMTVQPKEMLWIVMFKKCGRITRWYYWIMVYWSHGWVCKKEKLSQGITIFHQRISRLDLIICLNYLYLLNKWRIKRLQS
jgi:hypothetical protein